MSRVSCPCCGQYPNWDCPLGNSASLASRFIEDACERGTFFYVPGAKREAMVGTDERSVKLGLAMAFHAGRAGAL